VTLNWTRLSLARRAALAWLCAWIVVSSAIAADLRKFVFEKAEMGLPFRITLYASSEESAKTAADAAFARIAELNQVFRDYEDSSELSQLSRASGSGQKVKVSDPLWVVLLRAQELAQASGGAFDVTCGPLTSVWRRARRKFELPSPELVAEMKARCGWRNLRLDPTTRSAELLLPQMRLDLGSLAKGYAVDAALMVLRQRGIDRALVAGGGDMAAGDAPPGRLTWRIEVAPLDVDGVTPATEPVIVGLRNSGIATSGDRFQRLEIGGKRYSHILDMRTGQPLTDHSLVTVIAPDCFTASISTVLCVLGPEDGQKIADKWRGAARWQRKPDGTVEITTTRDWDQWVIPASDQNER
jgi:thiamine biosynthesis lipoprotein